MPLIPFILVLAFAAYGQQERIAIIQTLDDRDSIGFSDLAYLTDRLRETAVNVLPSQRYGIMTTESIVAFLGSQERAIKACKEASCLAELGRKVSADYVAQAHIGRFDRNLTIKTELYNSKSGNLIGSFTGSSPNVSGLLTIIDDKASDLFKRILVGGISSVSVKSVDTVVSKVFGILKIKQAYLDEIGKYSDWSLFINGKAYDSFENRLSLGNYDVRLIHGCYEDVNFRVGITNGGKEVFDMAGNVKLKKGGLTLNAERDGMPLNEPVFLNGSRIGYTPLTYVVPLCSVIEIGENREAVNVNLKQDGNTAYTHRIYTNAYKVKYGTKEEKMEEKKRKKEKEIEEIRKHRFSYGVRTGLNISNISGESGYGGCGDCDSYFEYREMSDREGGIGMQLGFVLDIAVSRKFRIQPGLMYIQKGSSGITAHYLEVLPLQLSLKFGVFRVSAGPYVSVLAGSDSDLLVSEDYGINAGFGFDIWRFYIGLFVDGGIKEKYFSISGEDYDADYTFQNSTLGLNLGYNF